MFDRNTYARDWYQKNKDKICEARKQWYKNNIEKEHANQKRYREAHPEYMRERRHKYYLENKEEEFKVG